MLRKEKEEKLIEEVKNVAKKKTTKRNHSIAKNPSRTSNKEKVEASFHELLYLSNKDPILFSKLCKTLFKEESKQNTNDITYHLIYFHNNHFLMVYTSPSELCVMSSFFDCDRIIEEENMHPFSLAEMKYDKCI